MLNSALMGVDLAHIGSHEDFKAAQGNQGSKGSQDRVLQLMEQERIAFTDAVAKPRALLVGTPTMIADMLEDYFTAGACDGFTLQPSYMPGGLEDFVELVVPILQQRGRLRTEYPGSTLRETLGLPAREWVA